MCNTKFTDTFTRAVLPYHIYSTKREPTKNDELYQITTQLIHVEPEKSPHLLRSAPVWLKKYIQFTEQHKRDSRRNRKLSN